MSTDIEILEPEVIGQQLAEVESKTGVNEDEALALRGQFADHYNSIVDLRGKVSMITDVEDPVQQKLAREIRLGLKDVRCNVERIRKTMKEESLRRGKAIDGFANVLKYLCEPVEEKLLDIEQYAERQEAARIAALVEDRCSKLECEGLTTDDATAYNLAAMSEEMFESLLKMVQQDREQKAAVAAKAEQDRIAREKAEADERERIRKENEKLKKEAAEREAELAKERKAKEAAEKATAEAKRKEDDRIAKEKAEADAKAKADRAAAAKAKRAPDREKVKQLVSTILDIELPKLTSPEGKDLMIEISQKRDGFACWIEKMAEVL